MTSDMEEILKSKRAYRERLAALPIEEKLRMLDVLRERSLEIAKVRRDLKAREQGSSNNQAISNPPTPGDLSLP